MKDVSKCIYKLFGELFGNYSQFSRFCFALRGKNINEFRDFSICCVGNVETNYDLAFRALR